MISHTSQNEINIDTSGITQPNISMSTVKMFLKPIFNLPSGCHANNHNTGPYSMDLHLHKKVAGGHQLIAEHQSKSCAEANSSPPSLPTRASSIFLALRQKNHDANTQNWVPSSPPP